VAAGAITYEWVPCPTCGCTTRWTRNYNCVVCRRRLQREADQRRRDREWQAIEAQLRVWAQRVGAKRIREWQAIEAQLRVWAQRVGAKRIHEAVVGAFVGLGRPLPTKSRSGRRGPYRRKDAKPQEPQP